MDDVVKFHKLNMETFTREMMEGDGGRSKACKVWDVLTAGNDNYDNCLGENFNQFVQMMLENFFIEYQPTQNTRLDYYFTTYILWLYLIVERIDFVFDVINKDGKAKLFSDFKYRNFETSSLIKKWANFLKHPKEFIFSHWPQYRIAGSPLDTTSEAVIIDDNFVIKNYSKSDTRIQELENCKNVIVIIPDLVNLTTRFCREFNTFIDFICENRIISEYLKDKTTLENYYEEVPLPQSETIDESK